MTKQFEEITVEQGSYEIASSLDLRTSGLGPCVGVLVGFEDKVSMLHASMPDASDCPFFDELANAIPADARANVCPILAGCHTTSDNPDNNIINTRNWVIQELELRGFTNPIVRWGEGGDLAYHNLCTDMKQGIVTIKSGDHNARNAESFEQLPLWPRGET